MASAGSRSSWVTHMGGLTAAPTDDWPADELAEATSSVSLLVARARDLAAVIDGEDVDRLAVVPDGARLVRDLALLPLAVDDVPARPGCAEECAERFLTALAGAGPAVYVCRRVGHPGHVCLFGWDGDDLCRRVLSAAHRLAGSPQAS